MLSFRNDNAGDLYVNGRVSEKRGFIHKSEGLTKIGDLYVNRVVSENQGLVCKSKRRKYYKKNTFHDSSNHVL